MSVNLSPVAGAAAQFLDNSGNVLTGGKLYTYLAGTTTPAATYTSAAGATFHSNPIILDAAGRVPAGGEIWLSDNIQYKFVLKDANDVLIATWDNLSGINSNFVNSTVQEEIQTATAGQTVFTLTTVTYAPGTNSLTVYVDGVNQYDGVGYAFVETDATTVTFTAGLHVGALVKFTTAVSATGNATSANVVTFTGFKGQTGTVQDLADDDGSDWIGFQQAGAGAVAISAQDKMRETISVKDFGAVGDGVADDTAAIQAAIDSGATKIVFVAGDTYITTGNTFYSDQTLVIDGTLKLASNQPIGTTMLKNDDPIGGNSNIVITGTGTIDGNRANQTGSTAAVWHTLVYFENCQHVEFSVKNAKGNYYPLTVATGSTGAIYAKDSSYVVFQNSTLSDWSREGFWIENSDYSKMLNLIAIGGVDSYSGYQFSGDYNEADNLYVEGAGASGGSMDSSYSTFSNLVAKDCQFFYGWGFGHGGVPASYSTATNVVSINNALLGSIAGQGGIGIVNGTEEFTLTNFYCADNNGRGVSISANANKIKISNGRCTNNANFGLVTFGNSGEEFEVTDVDLRGNVSDPWSALGGTATPIFKQVRLGNDPFESSVSLAGIASGGTLVVNNDNARIFSNIVLLPGNPAGAQALPALNTKGNGSFTVGLGAAGVSPASLRYIIL